MKMSKFVGLLPFMENEENKELAKNILNEEVKGFKLVMLYPFLKTEDLDELVMECLEKGKKKEVYSALPFVSNTMLNQLYDKIQNGEVKDFKLQAFYPFLDKDQIKKAYKDIINKAMNEGFEDDDDVYEYEEEDDE